MTARISDERLHELWETERILGLGKDHEDRANALAELKRSRALVTELRALADDLKRDWLGNIHDIADKLDSLLAAHDTQQAEGRE